MDSIGLRLVRAILNEKSFTEADALGVTEKNLFDEGRDAYLWVKDSVEVKGEWPTIVQVEENLGIDFGEDRIESVAYIADLARKRALSKSLENTMTTAVKLLGEKKPDEALSILHGLSLERPVKRKALISFKGKAGERYDRYAKLKSAGGLEGIATPWDFLNKQTLGWVNGSLNVITAMMNTGKTWFACINVDHSLRQKKKVLFVTLEMAEQRVSVRLDAIKYKIPYSHLRNCELTAEEDEMIRRYAKDGVAEEYGDLLIADKQNARTVADVAMLVREHCPDIVYIDGGYRFKGDERKGRWESTVSIVEDLQLAAEETGIPWVVTTQQGDANETGKEKKRGPHMSAWGVRYGKEWVINPDVVIGLYQNTDMRVMQMMEVHLLKLRDATGGSVEMYPINWDMTNMSFTEKTGEMEGHASGVSFE